MERGRAQREAVLWARFFGGGGFGGGFGFGFGGGEEEEQTPKGHDVVVDVEVSLEDLYVGNSFQVLVRATLVKMDYLFTIL